MITIFKYPLEIHEITVIACLGTGFEIRRATGPYVGTVQIGDGTVWHFYDQGEA